MTTVHSAHMFLPCGKVFYLTLASHAVKTINRNVDPSGRNTTALMSSCRLPATAWEVCHSLGLGIEAGAHGLASWEHLPFEHNVLVVWTASSDLLGGFSSRAVKRKANQSKKN